MKRQLLYFKKTILFRIASLLGLFLYTTIIAKTPHPQIATKANKTHPAVQIQSPSDPSPKIIAQALRWHSTPYSQHLCGGYFKVPANILAVINPPPLNTAETTIDSSGPSILRQDGATTLNRNVVATQKGRKINADKAVIFRDTKSGNIQTINLYQHARLLEAQKLIIAPYAHLNFITGLAHFKNALYRLHHQWHKKSFFSWGKAQDAKHYKNGDLILKNASYSNCSPLCAAWTLHASTLKLLPNKHIGVADNVYFTLGHLPVFYAPYWQFPIDNTRLSGFLTPQLNYRSKNGFTANLPYYFNLAPNYDLTLTPGIYSKRGVRLKGLFRYLTPHNTGELQASILPADQEFRRYKNTIAQQQPATPNPIYRTDLQKYSTTRATVSLKNTTKFDKVSIDLDLNYITDPYIYRDFSGQINSLLANQLNNQLSINYSGFNWQARAQVQAYQTLHRIDMTPVDNLYQRLPEIDLAANYPNSLWGSQFSMKGQYTNFAYHHYGTSSNPKDTGSRFYFNPSWSFPISNAAAYITPQISLDQVDYINTLTQTITPHTKTTRSRNIPIAAVTAGLNFDRSFHLFKQDYKQTLEPKIMYEYIPYVDQSHDPLFDTYLLPFSFSQVFALNQFTGVDRLQNTNQVALGLTSRIFNGDSGAQILQFDLGADYYFTKRKVCLSSPCQAPASGLSPLSTQLTYLIGPHLNLTGNLAWDTQFEQINNTSITADYHLNDNKVIDLGYEFVHSAANAPSDQYGLSNNTNLLSIGIAWPITHKISTLGYLYYNLSKKRAESAYLGVQYNTCCWGLRLIYQRYFSGMDPTSQNKAINRYGTNIYVQFLLKGLGDVSSSDPSSMIATDLPYYTDPFNPR